MYIFLNNYFFSKDHVRILFSVILVPCSENIFQLKKKSAIWGYTTLEVKKYLSQSLSIWSLEHVEKIDNNKITIVNFLLLPLNDEWTVMRNVYVK